MYLVAIAWIFVTLCMALTERSLVTGLLTFFFYGLAPLALLLWLLFAASLSAAGLQRRDKLIARAAE